MREKRRVTDARGKQITKQIQREEREEEEEEESRKEWRKERHQSKPIRKYNSSKKWDENGR